MKPSWARSRAAALDAVMLLREVLEDESADTRRRISGYIEAKNALAAAFEALAVLEHADPSVMANHKRRLEATMSRDFSVLPDKYLRVRGFGDTHARLLAYLTHNLDQDVPAAELRLLTRDAVHTERRTRELRDLGFKLDASHIGGRDVYRLRDEEPDLAEAARLLVRRNLLAADELNALQATELLHQAGLG